MGYDLIVSLSRVPSYMVKCLSDQCSRLAVYKALTKTHGSHIPDSSLYTPFPLSVGSLKGLSSPWVSFPSCLTLARMKL